MKKQFLFFLVLTLISALIGAGAEVRGMSGRPGAAWKGAGKRPDLKASGKDAAKKREDGRR